MVDYIDLNYVPNEKDLIVMYYLEQSPDCESLEKACEEIAKESSIGTWTDIATMSADIAKRLKPSAFSIDPANNLIKIAYNEELFEADNISQILSAIAGNIFGMKTIRNLRLIDVTFPRNIIKAYKGPFFGITGIRKMTGITNRPLLGTIVKPKVGLNEEEHARVCGEAWKGGLDIVKDDENLTNMKFNKFGERIKETLKMRDKIENDVGESKFYMPNVTAKLSTMKERAELVKKCGGEYIMVDILTVGFSALQEMRDYVEDLQMIIHAHRAMHAALTRNKQHGITMLTIAKLMRLIGVDQLHTGTIVGKMEGGRQEVLEINEGITCDEIRGNDFSKLDQSWYGLKPILPVASGGLSPLHIPELMNILGMEMVYQFGGGCHGHPSGTLAGAKAIRDAVDATIEGISLEEKARSSNELREALIKWKH
jgi:ribulose-bisphosphate carboxylase large chain